MIWPILGTLFALSILLVTVFLCLVVFKTQFYKKYKQRIIFFYLAWFSTYGIFIIFFTGPQHLNQYPPRSQSPYKLPWEKGISHWVAQGNRSFTSHRQLHHYAWDFFMMNGTDVLAARSGKVLEIDDSHDGIGLISNFVKVQHEDGQISGYFHIRRKSASVKVGDEVKQGQQIATSGMVGKTIYPHLHFAVFRPDGAASLPISFNDVEEGVPLAGRFYTSDNERVNP